MVQKLADCMTEEMKQRLQVIIKKCLLGTSCGFGGLEGSEFKSCGNSRAAADKGVEKKNEHVHGLATH